MSVEAAEKRKLSEVIALYSLEPELKDIYVEGASDKCLINRFTHFNDIEVNIIEINDIDFSEIYDSFPDIKANCKRKIIKLSEQLYDTFNDTIKSVICIIDRDFDEFFYEILKNNYLIYTDYTSIEMYFFNENSLNIFFDEILHGFPISSKNVLHILTPILNMVFNFKLALLKILGPKYEINNFDFKKLIDINKSNGSISFDIQEYIKRFLNANNLMKISSELKAVYEEISSDTSISVKLKIRGHDFVRLLYYYFDRIKNHTRINIETFERLVISCIDLDWLKNENLFKTIIAKNLNNTMLVEQSNT